MKYGETNMETRNFLHVGTDRQSMSDLFNLAQFPDILDPMQVYLAY